MRVGRLQIVKSMRSVNTVPEVKLLVSVNTLASVVAFLAKGRLLLSLPVLFGILFAINFRRRLTFFEIHYRLVYMCRNTNILIYFNVYTLLKR